MSKEQARLLRFAIRYPGWHSYGRDVQRVVDRLGGLGLLELSTISRQFRLARPVTEVQDYGLEA